MKLPRIKIVWTELQKTPTTIHVSKISNGYLIGQTFLATEDKLIEELTKYVKDPHAHYDPPFYSDTK